jgi:1-acyl-sn-glycerol-3-phosphate acyltransferase
LKALPTYPNAALLGWRMPPGVQSPGFYYRFWRKVCQIVMIPAWQVRVFNRHLEPTTGSVLYISNHQSFLDPMLVSFALSRPLNYMARDSLFRVPGFKQLIQSVNAFPVKRNTADTGALKEAIRRLRVGGQLVVFAEGTRTIDGRIGPFLPGVAMLAQRAADWTVPVVIDGAFEIWPRWQKFPSLGSIVVKLGTPIPQSQAKATGSEGLLKNVRQTLIEMQVDLRRRVGRPALVYPEAQRAESG